MVTVKNLVLGMLSANCYFVQNPDTGEMFLVDPAASPERIEAQIAAMDGKPAAILLTHGHYDHMLAADTIRKKYGIPVYVHEKEQELLGDGEKNLSAVWSVRYTMQADCTVKEGDLLEIAGYRIRVMATPGHTAGSVCYYLEDEQVLFSGDTLFCESYGRYDFPTSSGRDLIASVKRLLLLPEGVKVYPGHNESTDIEHEKRYNPLA
ncbi:MAG: MBL fold metallo-hydrolase [Fusicatenibacter sp.]|nr:MBL fold metallo-hydrolase [Lachnospiraceae bacterium]MDY2939314.1 MBL fold metallo-hydrolase [Fusicatenibacter sp.]